MRFLSVLLCTQQFKLDGHKAGNLMYTWVTCKDATSGLGKRQIEQSSISNRAAIFCYHLRKIKAPCKDERCKPAASRYRNSPVFSSKENIRSSMGTDGHDCSANKLCVTISTFSGRYFYNRFTGTCYLQESIHHPPEKD